MILFFKNLFRRINANYLLTGNQKITWGAEKSSMNENRLLWVDLEVHDFTQYFVDELFNYVIPNSFWASLHGLDIEKDKIIEMACLVTDSNLGLIAEGPEIVIHQPDSILDAMGEWCQKHHCQSGLTKAVRESKIVLETAEDMVLEFVKQHTTSKKCLLAGNSVHVDKMFLNKYMPSLMNQLHYRIVDVSTIKELCRYWYPKTFEDAPKKTGCHRALDDIKESLKELKFYRSSIFK